MKSILFFLVLIPFTLFADSVSENKCKAIEKRRACWEEKINECVWEKSSCKINSKRLADNATLHPDNDKCTQFKTEAQCTIKKTTLCKWSKTTIKCLLNEYDEGKSLNLPRHKSKFNPYNRK